MANGRHRRPALVARIVAAVKAREARQYAALQTDLDRLAIVVREARLRRVVAKF